MRGALDSKKEEEEKEERRRDQDILAKQHEATLELHSLLDVPSEHHSAQQKSRFNALFEVGHGLCGVLLFKEEEEEEEEEEVSSIFLFFSRRAPLEIWTFFYEPLACHFWFAVCVLPEARCLVRQWLLVHASVSEVFGGLRTFCTFLRAGGPRIRG